MTPPPRRLYLSALHKGSGKTSLTMGLAAALRQHGAAVHAFKRGPDYIDPGWLSQAADRPCRNLDLHTMARAEIRAEVAAAEGWALIEGNKGLHDGVDPQGRDSNAALAAELQTPVVLIVDARGMTRGVAPTVLGHAQFDPRVRVAGVILNRVGGRRHEAKLRQALAAYTDIPVLGAIPDDEALRIDAPYLGLIPAAEQEQAQQAVERLGERTAEHLDLAALQAVAETAPPLGAPPTPAPRREAAGTPVRIGIAHDRAFNFYYPGDLEALERGGAQLVRIDMLGDTALPPVDGLILGGGFPERHAEGLAANHAMKAAVAQAAAEGLPIHAECGGLLYLSQGLHTGQGRHAMAGVLPVETEMTERPQGHGYMALRPTADAPWSPAATGGAATAHEFHYSRLRTEAPRAIPRAYRLDRGHGLGDGTDGLIVGNTVAAYAHLRDTSACPWTGRFLAFVRSRRTAVDRT